MSSVFSDHILGGVHADRPAATAVPVGALFSCSTHNIVYRSDGTTWVNWATLSGGGGGGSSITVYTPGKNAAAHAADDTFDSDSGTWTNVNWSGATSIDYNSTTPGAMHVKSGPQGSAFLTHAKVKALDSGDWSKVLDVTVPLRNQASLSAGLVISTTDVTATGNQSYVALFPESAVTFKTAIVGRSNWGTTFNGFQQNAFGWPGSARILIRVDRISSAYNFLYGVLDPFSGVHWGEEAAGGPYGGAAYYGPYYDSSNGGSICHFAFHGLYHYAGGYPAGGFGIPKTVALAA